jgi:predicted nucleotidyltransferase component of viral defense system
MNERRPKNLSASVKSRLLQLARERKEDFNLVLVRYGIERLLYRISQSDHGQKFVLKGAMLFHLFAETPHRPTKDVDLLGRGSPDVNRMKRVIREIIELEVTDDGLYFDPRSVRADRIKEDQHYEGIRVTLLSYLGSARISLQIDIGFGDIVTPPPKQQALPCILEFEAPQLAVYPWETVVAEKFQALVELGMTNSRMKDFYDLYYMAREMQFESAVLTEAIRATFRQRKTKHPEQKPLALTKVFTSDPSVIKHWTAFVRRNRLKDLTLQSVVDRVWAFLGPIVSNLALNQKFDKSWKQGGPWK